MKNGLMLAFAFFCGFMTNSFLEAHKREHGPIQCSACENCAE